MYVNILARTERLAGTLAGAALWLLVAAAAEAAPAGSAAALAAPSQPAASQPSPAQEALQARLAELAQGRAVTVTLDAGPAGADGPPPAGETATLSQGEALVRFYAARDNRLFWDGPQGRPRLQQLLQAVEEAPDHGLPVAPYHLPLLRAALAAPASAAADPAWRAARDLAASDAFLTLARHLMHGRVDPRAVDKEWTIRAPERDPVPLLQDAESDGDVYGALRRAAPAQPGYLALMQGLAGLRRLAENGPWPQLPEGPSLKPGMVDERVPLLRARLVASGDMAPPPEGGTAVAAEGGEPYEGELVEAVIRFQNRHGLEPDGVVGKRTLAALNVPLEDRIRQVELNLERWRWLPADLGRRYVLVNIAGYDYRVIEDGVERLYGRTIVGTAYRSTPVFSDEIEYLVLNPKWTVPRKLAVEDKLPQIRKDPDFLRREGYKVYAGWSSDAEEVMPEVVDWHTLSKDYFPYRLVQAPGAYNALGQVKFLFPNKYDIYLHDTPSRYLFKRANRAFSSGCIRVEHPIELAEYLLSTEQGWDRARIDRVLAQGGKETWIRLRQPVPVHLLHWTAWQDPDGSLQLRDDLYGRDARLARALAAAAS